MNVYDSELVAGILQNCGYSETSDLDHADIIFRNQDDQNKLDYSGVPPTGVLQGSEVSGV